MELSNSAALQCSESYYKRDLHKTIHSLHIFQLDESLGRKSPLQNILIVTMYFLIITNRSK